MSIASFIAGWLAGLAWARVQADRELDRLDREAHRRAQALRATAAGR